MKLIKCLYINSEELISIKSLTELLVASLEGFWFEVSAWTMRGKCVGTT